MLQRFSKLSDLIRDKVPFVLVTLIETRGHAPQGVGAKILVDKNGLLDGTVGGGKVEAKVIARAQAILESNPTGQGAGFREFVVWNLQRDVGMSCGGEVSFFFEAVIPDDWHIAVFGAGHVAQSLVPLLLTLDCTLTCLDGRSEWLDRLPAHPKLAKIKTERMQDELDRIPPGSYLMLMTQGHALDLPILEKILKTRTPPYLGVIGSSVKAAKLRAELSQAGVPQQACASFFCPMGLEIGGNSPAEIAVSMAAQVIETRDRLKKASAQ